ncbi:MAG: carboxypeptidase regulatory-like domain-containing protein [Candidatus Acidiferrales bacterium]
MRFGATIAVLCLVMGAFMLPVEAQTASTGALTVTVTDSSGGAIANARVTITSPAGEMRTLNTGAVGSCTFDLLAVGNYEVEISAPGFKTFTIPSATVTVSETHVLKQALQIGAQTQHVTVNANVQLLQTQSSTVGGVVGERALTQLPLATRNFTQILDLSSGVSASVNNATQVGAGNQNMYVNGTGDVSNNYEMDGVDITTFMTGATTDPFGGLFGAPPIANPDSIEEFNVQTSQYDAEYGRSGGANVDIVTKTGTDSFHGGLYEFNRNDIFNANGFFQKEADLPRGELKQNQFGGQIGGPIIKQKLYFFGSYEGTRQVNGVASNGFSTISLPPQLTDDRTAATLGTEFCPTDNPPGSIGYAYSHAAFSAFNPVLDSVACDGSNISPVALGLLNAKLSDGQYVIPSPQLILPTGVGSASFSDPATYNASQALLNLDYVFSSKERLALKGFYDRALQDNSFQGAQPPGGAGTNSTGNWIATGQLTSILTSNLLNQAYFDFNNTRETLHGQFALTTTQFGVTPAAPYWTVFPQVGISGLFGFGGSYTDTGQNPQFAYEWGDHISWTHGRHTMRLGYDEYYSGLNARIFGRTRGDLTFLTFPDFLLGMSAAQNGTPDSNIYGDIATVQEADGTPSTVRENYLGAYIQDDYRMNSRLTWNLGLRWEYNGTPYELNAAGDQLNADMQQFLLNPIPPATGTYAGYTVGPDIGTPVPPGIPQRAYRLFTTTHAPYTNFAPRIGFAWVPLKNFTKLVVRGGIGVFYVSPSAGYISNPALSNPPLALTISRFGAANAASSWTSPYNPISTLGFLDRFPNSVENAGSELDPNLRASTMFSQSLEIQYAITPSLMWEVGYIGNRVEHITVLGNPFNVPQLATPTSPVNCGYPSGCINTNGSGGPTGPSARTLVQGLVPYGLSDYAPVGDSRYSSLQTTLRKNLSHGLQFSLAYTYGQTITDVRGASWVAGSSFNSNNPSDHAQLKGPADFNRPQRLVLNYTYRLPNFNGAQGFTGKVLSGWGVSGVTTAQSGLPFTLTDSRGGGAWGSSASRAQFCPGMGRSNVFSSGSLISRLNGYFNKSAFCAPPLVADATPGDSGATDFGNTPIVAGYGPGQFNWDIAFSKRTTVTESSYFEFTVQFFNAFNHPQFSNPNTTASSGAFGVISSTTVGPRIIQLGLKYEF